jgi:hypothetical protein
MKEGDDYYKDTWGSEHQQQGEKESFFKQGVRLMEALTWYVTYGYYVHAYGLAIGTPAYFLSVYLLYSLLYVLFSMERLSAAERFFHKEDPRQGSNIVTFVKMDRV